VEGAVEDPDPQLVAAARDGDLRAFEAIVRRYQADVWRLAYHLLHDESSAEDVTQEAFVRVFRFLPRYRGDSKFSTWMFSVARNCALDEVRRSQRRRRTIERAKFESTETTHESSTRLEVRDALAELPLELREPVVWIDMFGITYQEVANVMGVPLGTIKSRVHRARELLAASLLRKDGENQNEA
jgi:RNA polymerase sigma-70 factor (ECF subfamily)